MKNFLYLCLFGTALASTSVYSATPIPGYSGNPFVSDVNSRITNGGVDSSAVSSATTAVTSTAPNSNMVYTFPSLTPGATEVKVQTATEFMNSQNLSGAAETTNTFNLGDGVTTTVTGAANTPSTFTATTTDTGTGTAVTQVVAGGDSEITNVVMGANDGPQLPTGTVTPTAAASTPTLADGTFGASTDTHGTIVAQNGKWVDGQGNTYGKVGDSTINVEGTDYEVPTGAASSDAALTADGGTISGTVTDISDGDMVTVTDANGVEHYVSKDQLGDAQLGDEVSIKNQDGTSNAVANEQAKTNAEAGTTGAGAAAKITYPPIDKAVVFNVAEYVLQILEAVEGLNQDDATKETTVKAQKLQDSQGSTCSTADSSTVSLEGTNLASAAQSMITLLNNNQIDTTLLDDSKCVTSESEVAVGTGGSSGTPERSGEIACIREMHRLFEQDAALSAQMIAEGSNAISAQFYDRVSALTTAAKTTMGTIGVMSVINDSERYPYFEMVRGTALSAVQLWLKGAGTYSELDVVLTGGTN